MSDGPFRRLHGHHEGAETRRFDADSFDQVGTAAGFSKTRGFHTFGERLAIKDGSGHEFGAIQWAAARKTGSCSRSKESTHRRPQRPLERVLITG